MSDREKTTPPNDDDDGPEVDLYEAMENAKEAAERAGDHHLARALDHLDILRIAHGSNIAAARLEDLANTVRKALESGSSPVRLPRAGTAPGGGSPTPASEEIGRPAPTSRADSEPLKLTLSKGDFLEVLPRLYDCGTHELMPGDPPEVVEEALRRISRSPTASALLRWVVSHLHKGEGVAWCVLGLELQKAADLVCDYLREALALETREELLKHVNAGGLPRRVPVPASPATEEAGS